jgi:hypothetical protein
MSNTLRRLLESLKSGPLGKRERQPKKVDISPEPRAPRRKSQKLANKRITLTSRVDPVAPDGFYLYTLKGTNELLDVDQLVKKYGGDAQLAVLEYDETQQFNFDAKEVVSEEIVSGRVEVMIRFWGYTSHFDMKIWADECTYSGFNEAYARFKGAKGLDAAKKTSPLELVLPKSADFLPSPTILPIVDNDELYLEDMDCDSDPIVQQPVPKEKEECNAIPSLELIPEKVVPVEKDQFKDAGKKRKAKQAKPFFEEVSGMPLRKRNEAAVQVECISDEESSDALPPATKKKLTKAQFKKKVVDPQNSSDLRTQGALAGLFFQSTDIDETFLCKLCDKGIKSGGGVSNLVKHLLRMHKSEWEKCKKDHQGGNDAKKFVQDIVSARRGSEKKQLPLDKWFDNGTVTTLASRNLALLVWAIRHQIAFYPFEPKQEWKQFADASKLVLDSPYQMKKSTETLSSVIQSMAEERFANCTGISITGDMWSAFTGHKSLVMTYHALDPVSFDMKHHVLDLMPISGNATGNLLSECLHARVARHLKPKQKLVAVVFDSGANMLKAADVAHYTLHPCIAHAIKGTIDAVCGDAPMANEANLYDSQAALDFRTIKNVANTLRMTKWLDSALKGEEEDMLTLILECVTRWEAKFLSLKRFISLKDRLVKCRLLTEYYKQVEIKSEIAADVFSNVFFRRLEGHMNVLKVFHDVSVLSQAENQCSIAWIPSWIWKIQKACNEANTTFGSKLGEAVRSRLVHKFLIGVTPCINAALLNPITAKKVKSHLGGTCIDEIWKAIISEAVSAADADQDSEEVTVRTSILEGTRLLLQKRMKEWREALTKDPRRWDDCVFGFWRECANDVAAFKEIASHYLGIPATSAPSERTFSSTGGVVDHKRNKIGDELLENLTICRDYILQKNVYTFEGLLKALEKAMAEKRDKEVEKVDQ